MSPVWDGVYDNYSHENDDSFMTGSRILIFEWDSQHSFWWANCDNCARFYNRESGYPTIIDCKCGISYVTLIPTKTMFIL
jgi:hypothetical protein